MLYHAWTRIAPGTPLWLSRLTSVDWLKVLVTMLVVLVGWSFFRAPVLEALQLLAAMFRPALELHVQSAREALLVVGVVGGYYGLVLVRHHFGQR